jgi:type II secretory pathway component PulF
MDFYPEIFIRLVATAFLLAIGIAVSGGILLLIHLLLTLPMRRAERARLFLDLIETAIKHGQPIEEIIISISQSRDQSMGVRFHLLAAWLEQNLRFSDALAKVPRLLPPQVSAMLRAGQKIGDVRKVLPACRQLLKDAVSQTRGAINYLVVLTFVITPAGFFVFWMSMVFVIPKYMLVAADMAVMPPLGFRLFCGNTAVILFVQTVMLSLLWLAVFIYIGGPRVVSWFPVLERLYYRLPWRRKRMQRDFSAMLAILLDSGVPEPEALTLAADCTANKIFKRRAARAMEGLKQGMKLTEAVKAMDDAGEFGWRLTNAFHAHTGFLRALAGWHESLDAKAFQQEQAAAHSITTALVLWSGLFVGAIAISVFMFLVSIIHMGVLW